MKKFESRNLSCMKKAEPMELQAWMWSWGIIGLGIGAYFSRILNPFIFWILLVGLLLHGWSMFKVYLKK